LWRGRRSIIEEEEVEDDDNIDEGKARDERKGVR